MTELQQALIADLNLIENAQERLAIIVERARRSSAGEGGGQLAAHERHDSQLVAGCISQVWLSAELGPDGRCRFRCAADSPLVNGLVSLLCEFFSGCTPAEILACETEGCDPLAELGLLHGLSPTRRNGLAAVRARIFHFAQAQERHA
ncbi:hypothetical protein AXK11_02095 [Cephaloticoccus primus]|uniref:Fe-S metabolism associated domain-containing protein n=1 Tax=Cephaloticoccus primus TaxID=1548207 RepID=A0A139SSP9_9BACT|nr:SufE family protein [Cephaloticoccus primus]KXU37608.1 hypothetical protein AXK11_02095 [Cephaloticoccus primus]